MGDALMNDAVCWCGNRDLSPFSPGYAKCQSCVTLVSLDMRGLEITPVGEENRDFYGRDYWFSHQETDLGQPNIVVRARADLPTRCLYWLRTVLKYKLPPGRVLELGSGSGAFVAMLRWAGFDATGLEISPWVVGFARDTFGVPVLLGPVEDQRIDPASLDIIVLMDVLEHLRKPESTARHCLRLLKPDGILCIQTPCLPESATYEEMLARSDRFLEMLQPKEHLYLFSRRSIGELFGRLGAPNVVFEHALFAEYDMFLFVSRGPALTHSAAEAEEAASGSPEGRMVQALLDVGAELDETKRRMAQSEEDRERRLEVIEAQGQRLGEMEAERNDLRAEVAALRGHLDAAEVDRAARLAVIQDQGRRLGEMEGERNNLRAEVSALHGRLEAAEADRATRLALTHDQGRRLGEMEAERNDLVAEVAALRGRLRGRLEVIHQQDGRLAEVQAEVGAQLEQIRALMSQLRMLQRLVQAIRSTRSYRLLRKLGRWKFMEQTSVELSGDSSASPLERSMAADQPSGRADAAAVEGQAEQSKFDACFAKVREPKRRGAITYAEGVEGRIVEGLLALGLDVRQYEVDVADYRRYVAAGRYVEQFPGYYAFNLPEKSLEHYLAAKLLNLQKRDVYIDVASERSPAPDIYRRLFGIRPYRQDLAYPRGIRRDRIGGTAARMPVPDGFATKMALHCSFEHFEGESDIGFIREAGRVLRPGGALCVVPLYLFEHYAIQTDPEVAVAAGVAFEADATVYCTRGWGNRHGRFYDPAHLAARVLNHAAGMTVQVYQITNAAQADLSCHVRFALLLKKLGSLENRSRGFGA